MPAAPSAKKVVRKDWRAELSEKDWGESAKAKAAFVANKGIDPEDFMSDVKRFLYELGTADKLAFFSLASMFLASFFPWKETASEGEILGLLSAGVVVWLLTLIAMLLIAARVRNWSTRLNPLYPWIGQLFAAGFSTVWCLLYIRWSWDSTLARSPVGNFDMWTSKPSFGVIFALIAGAMACVGTIFGLKDPR
jgi:hypothetical protein